MITQPPLTPSPMHVRRAVSLVLGLTALGAGCRSATDIEPPGRDSLACPQTYEFGNYGCARVLVIVEGPPDPLPDAHALHVGAVSASSSGMLGAHAPQARVGPVPLQLTWWILAPSGRDTASVWVFARVVDLTPPVAVGVPIPALVADSALRVMRRTPVGAVPTTDTVRLVLRRP